MGALACDSPDFLGPACSGMIALAVSPETAPRFSWAPECAVGGVYVIDERGQPMWDVQSDPEPDLTPTNHILSGVVYGQVPSGPPNGATSFR
jgi:hypothetical protein